MEKLNNDIYDITETVQDLQQRYIDEETEDTLSVGIYGYMADIQSLMLQNAIITTGELGNELFPARAKFEKNVIAHSIIQNIEYINAVPATIKAILGIFEEDLEKYMVKNTFTLDKDITFPVDTYPFHLEYDIIITKNDLPNGEYSYTARYDMSRKNPLSEISNPYLNAPFIQYYSGKKMIYFYAELMQVSHTTFNKTLITNNLVENKTVIFTFSDQLADFMVRITYGDEVVWLTPVFEGMGLEQNLEYFCYYTYIDSTHVRVRFDSSSYIPKVNSKIDIFIKTTVGSSGNFTYDNTIFPIVSSDTYNYQRMPMYVQFASNSEGGKDRKSVDELRKMLPKEALSRGSITCWQDLENYFNMLNTDQNRLIIQKRVDNQFERSYFAYLLLKDIYNNVIPTNTIDIIVKKDDFDTHDNKKFVLKPGCRILLNDYDNNQAEVIPYNDNTQDKLDKYEENDKTNFLYTTPMMVVVTGDPLYVSYYMTIINRVSQLDFSYINPYSIIQFIATSSHWQRKYLTDPDTYNFNIQLSPNITIDDFALVETDDNNKVLKVNVKVFVVLYNEDSLEVPYGYIKCYYSGTDSETGALQFKGEIKTEDVIDDHNKIYISGLYRAGESETTTIMLLTPHVEAKIYVCADFNEKYGEFGRYDIDNIVPNLKGWTVANMYTIENGLDLYENFSEIISSQVTDITIPDEYTNKEGFKLLRVPVIRRSYAGTEENMQNFLDELHTKKQYIDHAITLLEDNFLIDFKFFNTYGPSRIYTRDSAGSLSKIVDRVNLTMNFEIKLLQSSDKYTKEYILRDIKEIVEDLNDITSLHIPNLITTITNKYSESIEYIEFLGFNDYGAGTQHLYRHDYNIVTGTKDVKMIPEFLTVHTDLNMEPDINIRLA